MKVGAVGKKEGDNYIFKPAKPVTLTSPEYVRIPWEYVEGRLNYFEPIV